MLGRIWNLVLKEILQIRRDRLLVAFLILGPMLQLFLLAQATGRGIDDLPTAVLDRDGTSSSRQLISALNNTEELEVRYYPDDEGEVRRLLDGGQVDVAVVIPSGFAKEPSSVQVIGDGSNSIVAYIGLSAAQAAITDFALDRIREKGLSTSGSVDLRPQILFNPTLNTRSYAVSAQLGFIVYQVTLTVAALGLARERELGTLEQLLVAPLRRLEIMAGKGIPALLLGLLNFLLLFLVARLVFQMPMHGSFFLLFGSTALFVTVEIGWGLIISTLSRSQQQAVLLVFLLAITDMTFSGYLVRMEKVPWLLQMISRLFPFQHYLAIVRHIVFKGATLDLLWGRVGALLLLGVAIYVVTFLSINRRLD